jgi:hypothetical protein
MSETPKGRTKLTLKDLKAIEVPESTALPQRRTTGSVPSIGDARSGIDPNSYLPEGVSPEVAALLGKPSREQAERAAVEREEAEKARIQAEKTAVAAAREASEQERLAMEAALADAQARQAAEEAARARQMKMIVSSLAALILTLVVALLVIMSQPPLLDGTPYTVSQVPVAVPVAREVEIGFNEIPAPIVAPVEEESSSSRSRTTTPRRARPSVRRSDLF